MKELRSHFHPPLLLSEHLNQIRQAGDAIWKNHSQRLRENVADAKQWFESAISLHDAGKANRFFQAYIQCPARYRGPKERKSHTPLSAVLALFHGSCANWNWRQTLAVTQIAAGHHSEFKSIHELDNSLAGKYNLIEEQLQDFDWNALDRAIGISVPRLNSGNGMEVVCQALAILENLHESLEQFARSIEDGVTYRLLSQLSFSILLEADKAFLAVSESDLPEYLAPRNAELPPDLVEQFIRRKPCARVNSVRSEARQQIQIALEVRGHSAIQSMTLPTGIGKTLLASTWALSLRQKLRAMGSPPPLVLIVLPFLAIIDQTVDEYQQLFQNSVEPGEIISFHSLSDRFFGPDLEDGSQEFFLDTWQSEVVITTFDQFLFALFSPKARHQLRFHHLTDAIIVMDEVQAIPCRLWHPVQTFLRSLTQLGTTHLLSMSATQPGFIPSAMEIIDNPESFFQRMQRFRLDLEYRTPQPIEQFLAECQLELRTWKDQRVLITLNTRRSAKLVLDTLSPLAKKLGIVLEFLTADVTPRDRLAAIRRVKGQTPCLVISTQCVEAGVDIDMDLVIRDFAPLDSLIQIAGRCNRNGERPRGTVRIVSLTDGLQGRAFAAYVYDPILLDVTRTIFGTRLECLALQR